MESERSDKPAGSGRLRVLTFFQSQGGEASLFPAVGDRNCTA